MPREIRCLTGLRGVAACLVVLFHAATPTMRLGMTGAMIDHGYLWVDLFFVLSGFVMAMVYGSLFETRFAWTDYVTYLVRRLARIYPLYLAILLEVILLSSWHGSVFKADPLMTIPANLVLVQAWGISGSLIGPSWSVSTEVAAYVLFPLLIAASLSPLRWRAWALGGLAVAAIIWLVWLPESFVHQPLEYRQGHPLNISNGEMPYPLVRTLAGFSLGLLTFRLSRVSWLSALAARPWSHACVMALVVAIFALPNSDALVVVAFPWLVLSLAGDRGPLARILRIKPIYWLGVWSYGIYLLQDRLGSIRKILEVRLANHDVAVMLLLLAVNIAVAAAAHEIIEKPGRRIVTSLWQSRRKRVVPA